MARIPGVGDTLGPYRITRQLGAGGMGVVFEAVEEGLGRRVALKVLAVQLAEEPEFRSRFLREATVLARSDSPHIIQVYSHGEHEGVLYLATQFVSGGDLAARVAQDGLPSADSALDLAAQVASALADAHAVGVVHRDVKPHNVLLRAGQDQVHAYLCDFGIARDDESSLTSSGVVAGTYAYLAPERFRGEPATPASDIYALGCLLWFLLTGAPPYDGGPVQLATQHEFSAIPQLPGAPAQLNAFLTRAMAKDPAARHPSAAAAAAHLRAVRAAGGLPAGQFAAPPQPPPPSYLSAGSVPSAASEPSYQPAPPTSPVPAVGSAPPVPPPFPPTPVMPTSGGEPRPRTRLAAALVALAVVLGVGAGIGWSLLSDEGGGAGDGGSSPSASGSASDQGPRPDDGPVAPADVDGDGYDDTIVVDRAAGETVVLVSDPDDRSRFGDLATWSRSGYDDAKVVRGDFTGDGLADLALVEPDQVRIAASTRREFAGPEAWLEPSLPERFKVTTGDFDADGSDDLAFLTGAGTGAVSIDVALAGDGGFREPERWAGIDGLAWERTRIGAADLDGDRRADFVAMVEPPTGGVGIRALHSTGDGFDDDRSWYDAPTWTWEDVHLVFGDVDGDELADVVAVQSDDGLGLVVLRSDGSTLVDGAVGTVEDLPGGSRVVAADADGDDRTDLVVVDGTTGAVRLLRYGPDGFAEAGRTTDATRVSGDDAILVGITR